RCGGGGRQPACNTCCTGFAQRQNNRQRRCACKPDNRNCRRDGECCSGLCCTEAGEKFCFPGAFTCNGRCPEESCAAP
ncbi:MAG: hypothetical protein M3354_00475, partial [Chloroflexota bacterium]|nr:hypothetical protein [Chloroflexota bacterium]